jgi:hypothetical protein
MFLVINRIAQVKTLSLWNDHSLNINLNLFVFLLHGILSNATIHRVV